MRYRNWDILIFPDDLKVPVQEFDTKCQALPVSSENQPSQRLIAAAGNNYHNSVTQVPTLTCFVASLEAGRPFRMSIHSWERPKPSELLLNLKPSGGRVAFEARLSIDGQLKAQRYLGEHNTWPEVINNTGSYTTEYVKELCFPPFHSEILRQSHWDAGDGLGRIRLVIAEGIAPLEPMGEITNFQRLRDVVAFSFQHAPRQVLEFSGIAWPNDRMFHKNPPAFSAPQPDADTHAHSPQRAPSKNELKTVPALMPMHAGGTWSAKSKSGMTEDPFVGPPNGLILPKQRKTNTDVSMPDYQRSRVHSEMSEIAMQQPDFQQQLNQAAVEEIIRSLHPMKKSALVNALSPSKAVSTTSSGSLSAGTLTATNSRVNTVRSSEIAARSSSAGLVRRSSTGSQRSTSGRSRAMSWDQTPTSGELWANLSDFPGLLPSIQSNEKRDRTESGSKRKRSSSPVDLLRASSDMLNRNMKGMSTSPMKKTPTPIRRNVAKSNSDEQDSDKENIEARSLTK